MVATGRPTILVPTRQTTPQPTRKISFVTSSALIRPTPKAPDTARIRTLPSLIPLATAWYVVVRSSMLKKTDSPKSTENVVTLGVIGSLRR